MGDIQKYIHGSAVLLLCEETINFMSAKVQDTKQISHWVNQCLPIPSECLFPLKFICEILNPDVNNHIRSFNL